MLSLRFFSCCLLFLVVEEDRRHVLPRHAGSRVVTRPEYLEEILVAHDFIIVVDLHTLSVITTKGLDDEIFKSQRISTVFLEFNSQTVVGRSLFGTACIPDTGTQDSGDTAELCLRKPKSAESESGGLSFNTLPVCSCRCDALGSPFSLRYLQIRQAYGHK